MFRFIAICPKTYLKDKETYSPLDKTALYFFWIEKCRSGLPGAACPVA
jgi:hypothetical protein